MTAKVQMLWKASLEVVRLVCVCVLVCNQLFPPPLMLLPTVIPQVKKETKFDPPFSNYKQLGAYPSNIRLNFNGFVEANLLRDAIAFFDDNAFVTLWTTIILLEAQKFSKPPPAPSEDQLHLALRAISTYHDKNQQSEDSVLVFWPQTYNATTDTWVCGPVNLGGVAHDYKEVLDFVTKVLDNLGLGHLWDKFAAILNELYVIHIHTHNTHTHTHTVFAYNAVQHTDMHHTHNRSTQMLHTQV